MRNSSILVRDRVLKELVGLFCIGLVCSPVLTTAAPTQSSPIAISSSDSVLVNVNPDNNSVSVFDLTGLAIVKRTEIPVGKDPSSVAIHPTNGRAYVANSFDGTISVINLTTNAVENTVPVGVEPMALVLSPNGTRLYVANSSSNTMSVVNSTVNPPTVVATVNLSSFGTAPRAIAVTNDGDADDTDETVFVPLFFSQVRPATAAIEGQDDQREGRVVAIAAATNTLLGAPNPIRLGPQSNTGFNSNGKLAFLEVPSTNPQTFTTPTGAFPNQLASVAIHPTIGIAYVVSTGASPNGPFRFNSNAQGLVSAFNTATRSELLSGQTGAISRQTAPLNLNQGINLATTPAPRVFLTNPVAMAWRSNASGTDAWVVIQESDMVVRLTVDANGIPTIGAPLVAGPSTIMRADLLNVPSNKIAGKAPRGIVISNSGNLAFVFCYVSRSITGIDISNPLSPSIYATARASNSALSLTAQLGAEMFFAGRGPQGRLSSESWGGCVVCHPLGRSDNVTWMFDTGPRQTISLDGMFSKTDPSDQRVLNWSAVRDENHDFELNTRNVFGGRGLIDDDRLFLAIGGANGATPTDSALIEQFQNFTGAVTTTNDLVNSFPLPQLLGARRDFGIATLADDRVFIIGGRSGVGQGALISTNAVLEFNPHTNALVARSSTGFTLRHSLGAAAIVTSGGPRIYAIGGYSDTLDTATPVSTVEEYNPSTNTWRTVASLPTAVAQFGIAVAGGINTAEPRQLIHVHSGNKGSEAAPALLDSATFTIQRFQADPVGPGIWSTFNPAGLTARRNHGIATVLRGTQSRVFVIGGQNAAGTVLDTVDEYVAQTVATVATPHTSLPSPRARFGIGSTLTSNQIYVMGGVDGAGADQTSIFEYTAATNGPVAGPPGTPSGTWVIRGILSTSRRGLAVSTPPGVTNLLPAKNAGRSTRQDAIAVWIQSNVRSSKSPVTGLDPGAIAGRALFAAANCHSCHGGSKWTRSKVNYNPPPSPAPGLGLGNESVTGAELTSALFNVGTFDPSIGNEFRSNAADISQPIVALGANGFNIPSLLNVHETAPYFHSGGAPTLEDVLNNVTHRSAGTSGVDTLSSPADRANLVAFLRSIDSTTLIFP